MLLNKHFAERQIHSRKIFIGNRNEYGRKKIRVNVSVIRSAWVRVEYWLKWNALNSDYLIRSFTYYWFRFALMFSAGDWTAQKPDPVAGEFAAICDSGSLVLWVSPAARGRLRDGQGAQSSECSGTTGRSRKADCQDVWTVWFCSQVWTETFNLD